MTENNAAKEPTGGRLVLVLFLIAAITALLLGLTDYVTRDRIEARKGEKTAAAMQEVLPAANYEALDYTGGDSRVLGVYKAGGGNVVQVKVPGSQGLIEMMIGIGADGRVTGVSIVSMSETSGLGANAAEPGWRAQFLGADSHVAIKKDGGDIDALTGATVTSRAMTNGVNAALDAVASLH